MNAVTPRRSWGAGRVAFLAILDTIRAELRQGYPLTTIFARHQAALGIRYPGFCKLVRRYAEDAKVINARPPISPLQPLPQGPSATPPSRPPLSTPLSVTQGSSDAGCQSTRRTFNHDPIERPDDRRRLLGED